MNRPIKNPDFKESSYKFIHPELSDETVNNYFKLMRAGFKQLQDNKDPLLLDLDKVEEYNTLEIRKSEQGRGISLTLPPDIAICDECLKDMRNSQKEKYYNYPFIACAVCGPRFTTVTELPYDRERTTMNRFHFCKQANPESCEKEYSDFIPAP